MSIDASQNFARVDRPASQAMRRVRKGVSIPTGAGVAPTDGIGMRLWHSLSTQFGPGTVEAALEYARDGQTVRFEVSRGSLQGQVQGRSSKPYQVTISLEPLGEDVWNELIAFMAKEAAYEARLLSNELPVKGEELAGRLIPTNAEGVSFMCTCPYGGVCKHVATLCSIFCHHLANEPLLLFEMRGMNAAQILERLTQNREIQTQGVATAHIDPWIPESRAVVPSLQDCLDDYWRCGSSLAELERRPPMQYPPQSLLRRLGPSPMRGKFPFVGLLASVYEAVSEQARISRIDRHID